MDKLRRVLTFRGHEVQAASDVNKVVSLLVSGILGHNELALMRKALHCMFVIMRPQRFDVNAVNKAEASGEKLLNLYTDIERLEEEGEKFKRENGLIDG